MKLNYLVIVSLLIISSCGFVSKKESNPNIKNVSIHGTVHKPYCGGAKPSPDVAKGYYETMKFEKFMLLQGTDFKEGMKIMKEIEFDEGGNIQLNLEKGDYMLMAADKFLSLEEFIKANGAANENYQLKDNSCFLEWKNSVDFSFTIEGDTIMEMRKRAKCWVGINPCLNYIGPPAE